MSNNNKMTFENTMTIDNQGSSHDDDDDKDDNDNSNDDGNDNGGNDNDEDYDDDDDDNDDNNNDNDNDKRQVGIHWSQPQQATSNGAAWLSSTNMASGNC